MVALGYAAGRYGWSWAKIPFWIGQVVSFAGIAIAATSSSLSLRQRVWLVALQAAQQSFVGWMYSPLFFSFPDEFLHWVTASDILHSHHLFYNNAALPVSPDFPGLEEITTALVSLTGLGLFTAGSAIAFIGHVTFAVAIFLLFVRVMGDQRSATIAAVLFAANPDQASFVSLFIYENPALVLMAVALLLAISGSWQTWAERVPTVACLGAVVVTHHLTAAVTILLLLGIGLLVGFQTRLNPMARRLVWLALATAAWAAVWVVTTASAVVPYLAAPLNTIATGIAQRGNVKGGTVPLPAGSLIGSTLAEVGAVITALLIIGAVVIVRRREFGGDRRSLIVSFVALAVSYFFVLAIREVASNGAELATRLLTYVSIFTAVAATVVFTYPQTRSSRRRIMLRVGTVACLLLIFIGNVMNGWPAQWEVIPGRFRIDAFEAGIDRQNLAAAQWFRTYVGPGQTVACDFTMCGLLVAYDNATVVGNVSSAYYALTFTPGVIRTLRVADARYLFVDRRMAQQAPITGQYFASGVKRDVRATPVPIRALDKFNHAPGVTEIYTSGSIAIYDLKGLFSGR